MNSVKKLNFHVFISDLVVVKRNIEPGSGVTALTSVELEFVFVMNFDCVPLILMFTLLVQSFGSVQ